MSLFGKKNQETIDPAMLDQLIESPGPNSDDGDASLSLLTGMGGGQAGVDQDAAILDTSSNDGGLLANNAVLLAVVVVVGGLSLWIMRSTQESLASDYVDPAVEERINVFLGQANSPDFSGKMQDEEVRIAAVSRDLARPWVGQQVPTDELAKNPFALGIERPEEVVDNSLELQQLRQNIIRDVDRLELGAVMAGANPVVVISGELYNTGDTLEMGMTIDSINTRTEAVILSHPELPGETFTLSMDNDDD